MTNTDLWTQARAKLDQAKQLIIDAEALGDQIVDCGPKYDFRGLYDINRYALTGGKLQAMGLNVEQVYQNGTQPDTTLTNALANLPAGVKGWTWMGDFTPSSSGGSFVVSATKLGTVMNALSTVNSLKAAAQPNNSHRYCIGDEPPIAQYTGTARTANLNTLKARRDAIHGYDVAAVCNVTAWNPAEISLLTGIVDELWITAYPNWVPYNETTIPNAAAAAEAAGLPYVFVLSCHENLTNKPAYPDQPTLEHEMDQIKATNARGVVVYAWDDGTPPSLATDSTAQGWIAAEMAKVTP